MKKDGLLLVKSNPPAQLEEEFNAWYDSEHLPERLSVPGFNSAIRLVEVEDKRNYLALYDLDSVGVLDTPAYLRFSGENFTPWTKRIVLACNFIRVVARLVRSAGAPQPHPSHTLLLQLRIDCDKEVETSIDDALAKLSHANVCRIRVFQVLEIEETEIFCVVDGNGSLDELLEITDFADGVTQISSHIYIPY